MKQNKTPAILFSDVLKQYYKSDDFIFEFAESTQEVIKQVMMHAKPLYKKVANTIAIEDVNNIIKSLESEGKYSTAKNFTLYIRKIITFAYVQRYIDNNITSGLEYNGESKSKYEYLTKKELGVLLKSIFIDDSIDVKFKKALYSLTITLIPIETLKSLTFDVVDFNSGIFSINKIKSVTDFKMLLPSQILSIWNCKQDVIRNNIIHIHVNTFRKTLKTLAIKYINKEISPENLRETAGYILRNTFKADIHAIRTLLMLKIQLRYGDNLLLQLPRFKKMYESNCYDERAKLSQEYANMIDSLIGKRVIKQLFNN